MIASTMKKSKIFVTERISAVIFGFVCIFVGIYSPTVLRKMLIDILTERKYL